MSRNRNNYSSRTTVMPKADGGKSGMKYLPMVLMLAGAAVLAYIAFKILCALVPWIIGAAILYVAYCCIKGGSRNGRRN